jgi:hypothetical protein
VRFARRQPAQDPVGEVRRFAREALAEHDAVQAGAGGTIRRSGEGRAVLSLGAFQSSVWLSDLRDPGSAPVFDPPVSADQLAAAMRFLSQERGHWRPVE